jgi:serine/threonine protein kinase
MAKLSFRSGQIFGCWTLKQYLGGGGNGEVWSASAVDGRIGAIKLLKKAKRIAYNRFRDEVHVLKSNPELPGVLPVLDSDLPPFSTGVVPWYVMPLAIPLEEHLEMMDAPAVISVFLSLADSLAQLHARGISHRDIKPANLFWYEEAPRFGDFGLVEYPEKQDLTHKKEALGPRWTRAPEMERSAELSDGAPADVYSLAKTIWIFLTGEPTAFEGQYMPVGRLALTQYRHYSYSDPLDYLLQVSTANDPDLRPSAGDFARGLEEWLQIHDNFHEYNTR